MKLRFTFENLVATPLEKQQMQRSFLALAKYAAVLKRHSEVVCTRVHVKKICEMASHDDICLSVTMSVPHATLHAEVIADSVMHGVDRLIPKIKRQISKYKARKLRIKSVTGLRPSLAKADLNFNFA